MKNDIVTQADKLMKRVDLDRPILQKEKYELILLDKYPQLEKKTVEQEEQEENELWQFMADNYNGQKNDDKREKK